MTPCSRGEFLGRSAALAAGLGLGSLPLHGPGEAASENDADAAPDLVLLDGRVYTVDDTQPRAEAFAIKNGRFVAVGSTDDVRNLVTSRTEVLHAAGMTVTPGFIDAHTHVSEIAVARTVVGGGTMYEG